MTIFGVEESADALLELARIQTGIDIVDSDALEPLTRYLRAVNHEGKMHTAGAKGMRSRTLRILSNRLRMLRDFAAHPEITDEKIEAPVMFCGLGRTGSTKMHKLVAASGDFNYLPYWMTFNPSLHTGDRSEDRQQRVDECIAYVDWFYAVSPDTPTGHPFVPMEAEEESYLLEHSLRSPVCVGWTPMPSFLEWLATQDMVSQFRFLKDALKYLQWQGLADPGKRWLLKGPLYVGMERELLSVFPDAALIMTHRDPAKVVASTIRLLELFHKPFTDAPVVVEFFSLGQAAMLEAHCRNREVIPDFCVLDLHFDELIISVAPALEKIYEFSGEFLCDESRGRMLAWEKTNPQHKYGEFRYSLGDYGLTDADIRKAYAIYDNFLADRFGK